MDSEASVEIYFFPFSGGGHQIPVIDMARLFAAHGASSTIIATPSAAAAFSDAVARDRLSGKRIAVHVLPLPDDAVSPNTDMSAPAFTDTTILRRPLELLLAESPPDCVVVDAFHRWATEALDDLGIRRITFHPCGCFSRCVSECLSRDAPHERVGSDSEPFVVPGLPDRVELTRSQLPARLNPNNNSNSGNYTTPPDKIKESEEKSFGVLVNSFYELEPKYAEFYEKEMGNKAWLVGPVSLCNRDVSDELERGQKVSVNEQYLLNWLDSKEPNSVVYISFGSLAHVSVEQLAEIAHALEFSDYPFIWVIGKTSGSDPDAAENLLPREFEEKAREAKRGLIIRGWAPQLLILRHGAVGGFVTHCGWNSTVEGLSAGVAMATWPMSAEQFFNEKLVTEVVEAGVRVGSEEWAPWNGRRKEVVGREKVAAAVRSLMGGGDVAEARRRRASAIGEMARRAVEEGGSSWKAAEALILELRTCPKARE